MIADSLRKIARELSAEVDEPVIDREVVQTAVRRIIAQAEMLDEGLDVPTQVSA